MLQIEFFELSVSCMLRKIILVRLRKRIKTNIFSIDYKVYERKIPNATVII